MKCPNCGEVIKGKFKFCGFCGADLKTGELPVEESFIKKKTPMFKTDFMAREKAVTPETTSVPVAEPVKAAKPVDPFADKFDAKSFKSSYMKTALGKDDEMEEVSSRPDKVKVIKVIGQNKVTACSMLEYLGLDVVIYTRNSETIPKGDIIEQNLEPDAMVEKGSIITLIASVGTWSEWSPEAVPEEKATRYDIEKQNEHRYRTRQQDVDYKVATNKTEYPDYIVYDETNSYSEWVEEELFSSLLEEETELRNIAQTVEGFKYAGWIYTGNRFEILTSYASPKLAVFFNPETTEAEWKYIETIDSFDSEVSYTKWHQENVDYGKTPAGDAITANISIAGYEIGNYKYAMKYGTSDRKWYKYKNRKVSETTYYMKKDIFTEWSDWTDWAYVAPDANELTDVETRTIYRYKRKPNEPAAE